MSADALLKIIAGRDKSSLIEVRCRSPRSGRIEAREWFSVDDHERAEQFIVDRSKRLDVYVGAAPRTRRGGGKAAIDRVWTLWADIDTAEGLANLRGFTPRPALVINSGSTGCVHAYWPLSAPLRPAWAERANRRIAHRLGADAKATDAARILRPPGTLNHKHSPPVRVTIEHLNPGSAPVDVFHLLKNLPDPSSNPPVRQPRGAVRDESDPLASITAESYYARLTGRPILQGNQTCPFHSGGNERDPSMRLYETTWHCFAGCGGGSIYQFGARLYAYALPVRGEAFKDLQNRLRREFG